MRASILIAPLLVLGGVAAYAFPSEYDTFDYGLSYLDRRSPGAGGSKAAKQAGKKVAENSHKYATGGAGVLAYDKYGAGGSGGGGGGTGGTGGAEDKKEGHKTFNVHSGSKVHTDNVEGNKRRSLLTPEEEHYFLVARHAEALDELEDLYYY
ncbi:hypothetical protein MMC26_006002 [Xylographa opegraphella]|nr:hypothetical protein [Xylographa opegraphella]